MMGEESVGSQVHRDDVLRIHDRIDKCVTTEFCAERHRMQTEMIMCALEDVRTGHNELKNQIVSLTHAIREDNGGPSFQTRIDRHEQLLGAMRKLLWLLAATLIGMMVKEAFTEDDHGHQQRRGPESVSVRVERSKRVD
jgi:hypothetical protein